MVEKELESYLPLIRNYAWVALKKIRKPTFYDHDDLIQEGIECFLEAIKYWIPERKDAAFKTYFTAALKRKYCDIVRKSYSPKRSFSSEAKKREYYQQLWNKSEKPNSIIQTHIKLLLEELPEHEKKYVMAILHSTQTHTYGTYLNANQFTKKREEIRQALKLSRGEEDHIRKNIIRKIREHAI